MSCNWRGLERARWVVVIGTGTAVSVSSCRMSSIFFRCAAENWSRNSCDTTSLTWVHHSSNDRYNFTAFTPKCGDFNNCISILLTLLGLFVQFVTSPKSSCHNCPPLYNEEWMPRLLLEWLRYSGIPRLSPRLLQDGPSQYREAGVCNVSMIIMASARQKDIGIRLRHDMSFTFILNEKIQQWEKRHDRLHS